MISSRANWIGWACCLLAAQLGLSTALGGEGCPAAKCAATECSASECAEKSACHESSTCPRTACAQPPERAECDLECPAVQACERTYFIVSRAPGQCDYVVRVQMHSTQTVLEALNHLGGFAVHANKQVWVERPTGADQEEEEILTVNCEAISQGGHCTNHEIQPGDRVYVVAEGVHQVCESKCDSSASPCSEKRAACPTSSALSGLPAVCDIELDCDLTTGACATTDCAAALAKCAAECTKAKQALECATKSCAAKCESCSTECGSCCCDEGAEKCADACKCAKTDYGVLRTSECAATCKVSDCGRDCESSACETKTCSKSACANSSCGGCPNGTECAAACDASACAKKACAKSACAKSQCADCPNANCSDEVAEKSEHPVLDIADKLAPAEGIYCPGVVINGSECPSGHEVAERRAQMVEVLRELEQTDASEEILPAPEEIGAGERMMHPHQRTALRHTASALEHAAARLEEAELYEEADRVRELAGQLRHESRQAAMQHGPSYIGMSTEY